MDTSLPPSEEFAPIPAWPKTVGIISICWGSLGLLCNGCGLAQVAFSGMMLKPAEEALKAPAPDVMKPSAIQAAPMALGLAWTILLVIAGIMLVGRKQASIMMHLVYGVGGILLGIIGGALGARQQLAIFQWAKDNPSDPWAKNVHPTLSWAIFGFFMTLAFVWPIFCTAWFSRHRKTDLGGTGMSEIV